MNEHAKLFRDSFNAFALACVGNAVFNVDEDVPVRTLFVIVGFYSHFIAHVAVAYGTLPAKSAGGRHG